jgi:hypothetical protein
MPCILLFSAEFVRKLKFPNNSNSRAGELVEGLTDTAVRNVRNLQDAIDIKVVWKHQFPNYNRFIGEIRKTNPIGNEAPDGIGSRSRFWRTFTLIAIPSAALLSGGLVWAFKR